MKLISINIEMDKHLHRILPFITSQMPDVLCLQEVQEEELLRFEALGYRGTFAPMMIFPIQGKPSIIGIALLSRHPLENVHTQYYSGSRDNLCLLDQENIFNTIQKVLICADSIIDGDMYTVATTHFTWTPNGANPAPEQISDMGKFLAHTATLRPHIMCGDFNIPREHNVLHHELTKFYTDAIPHEYSTSIDSSLHRLTQIPGNERLFDTYMVDYLLTQPPFHASDVRLEFGVSDHAAVVGTITKSA